MFEMVSMACVAPRKQANFLGCLTELGNISLPQWVRIRSSLRLSASAVREPASFATLPARERADEFRYAATRR